MKKDLSHVHRGVAVRLWPSLSWCFIDEKVNI